MSEGKNILRNSVTQETIMCVADCSKGRRNWKMEPTMHCLSIY